MKQCMHALKVTTRRWKVTSLVRALISHMTWYVEKHLAFLDYILQSRGYTRNPRWIFRLEGGAPNFKHIWSLMTVAWQHEMSDENVGSISDVFLLITTRLASCAPKFVIVMQMKVHMVTVGPLISSLRVDCSCTNKGEQGNHWSFCNADCTERLGAISIAYGARSQAS